MTCWHSTSPNHIFIGLFAHPDHRNIWHSRPILEPATHPPSPVAFTHDKKPLPIPPMRSACVLVFPNWSFCGPPRGSWCALRRRARYPAPLHAHAGPGGSGRVTRGCVPFGSTPVERRIPILGETRTHPMANKKHQTPWVFGPLLKPKDRSLWPQTYQKTPQATKKTGLAQQAWRNRPTRRTGRLDRIEVCRLLGKGPHGSSEGKTPFKLVDSLINCLECFRLFHRHQQAS